MVLCRSTVARSAAMLTLAALVGTASPAQSQQICPENVIRIVVPFPPGGLNDNVARIVGPYLSQKLGQPVIVENKSGASGIIGTDAVAKAAPDGYTLAVVASSHTVVPATNANMPFDTEHDLAAVSLLMRDPLMFVASSKVRAKTLKEFVALAKAQPGKINYGSFGIASMAHLNLEALKARVGVDMTHVPYKGAGPAVQAVVAGEAAATISSPAAVLGFLKDGRLRALAIGAQKRSPLMPDVPTLAEVGIENEVLASTYFAFALPAGTPKPIAERLNQEMKRAVLAPDVAQRLNSAGLEPTGGSGEELAELVRKDIPRFRKIIQDVGIQPE
jgi:tripartite-type tricarboxylate transporter receptor subunit TctC